MNSLIARIRAWLTRNREEAIDLVALGAAVMVPQYAGPALGWLQWGIVAIGLLLIPYRSSDAPSWWRRVLRRLPLQLGLCAAVFAANKLFLNPPHSPLPTFLWVWLAVAALLRGLIGHEPRTGRVYLPLLHFLSQGAGRDTALAGTLLATAIAWLFAELNPAFALPLPGIVLAGLLWLGADRVPYSRWQDAAAPGSRFVRWSVRVAIWGLAFALIVKAVWGVGLAAALGCATATVLVLAMFQGLCAREGKNPAETLRWLGVFGFSFWLVSPLAATLPLGSGDSAWYASTLADVLSQFRAGVFPIFVGQSEYQFNGAVFPVRVAPLFHHLAMLVDTVTLRTLSFGSVMNLVLISVGVAGGLTAYLALREILPARRGAAALLAGLYLSCPGIIALVYNGDLYMTWTTVPLIPLALLGTVRTFRGPPGFRNVLLLVVSLALMWWGHSPVALWLTCFLGLAQIVRLAQQWRERRAWTSALAAAAVFGVLVAYPIVSVLFVTPEAEGDNRSYAVADPVAIARFVKQAYPGIFSPVSEIGRAPLSDYQLGWALLAGLVLACAVAVRRRRVVLVCFCVFALFLLLLVVPIPDVNLALWTAIPDFIRNPTGNWAMARLFPLLGAFSVFALALALETSARSAPRFSVLSLALLAAGLAWSASESAKFVKGTYQIEIVAKKLPSSLLPENSLLTRYSYLMFGPPPPYYSHGYVDPLLEQRVFADDGERLIVGNAASLLDPSFAAGRTVTKGALNAAGPDAGPDWALAPAVTLQPGKRYVMHFDFAFPEATGVLIGQSERVHRVYELPKYGEALAFGSLPTSSRLLPLFTSGPEPTSVEFRFVAREAWLERDLSAFAKYDLIEYDPAQLPVHVTDWIPFTARVRSAEAGWLETPRVYQNGYEARVNGAEAQVKKSPRKLVMVQVPAGESEVTLEYIAPLTLKLPYAVSLLAFAGLGIFVLRQRLRLSPGA